MEPNQIIALVLIGLSAGLLGGLVGIGGGMIIVPALMYFLGLNTHQAIGTSMAIMLPPIGIMAAMNFYRSGDLIIPYAAVVAGTFIVGAYFGSKASLALKDSAHIVKLIFGLLMLYAAVRMIIMSIKEFK